MIILLSLWTIALGYFVFAHASGLKGEVKTVGRIAGLLVMLVALVGVFCGSVCRLAGVGAMAGYTDKCSLVAKGVCPIKK